jgi:class 3 adenylate cyclase
MSVAPDRLQDAAGFLPPEIRRALAEAPDGSLCRSLPVRRVALLWCDVTGFTRRTNDLLTTREDGVEELHRLLKEHYRDLLTLIADFGGEPVAFVGDGLLSVWEARADDLGPAVAAAAAAGGRLRDRRRAGSGEFDLNLNVACGEFRTIPGRGSGSR